MRFYCVIGALFFAVFVSPCSALFIGMNGLEVDSYPELHVTADGALRPLIELEIVNEDDGAVALAAAQVALTIVPIGGATGAVTLSLDDSTLSLFGTVASNLSPAGELVVTPQGFAFPLGPSPEIPAAERGLLATILASVSPEASGSFELIALPLDELNIALSSHWSPTGSLAFTPFENETRPTSGEILLATVTVGVPEPSTVAVLVLVLVLSLAGLCHRPHCEGLGGRAAKPLSAAS